MSSERLPGDILDCIVDNLHDMVVTLRSCSLVSKSWLPRTRRHLFAEIEFLEAGDLRAWKAAFPDPYTSPAYYYARALSVGCPQEVVAADADKGGWIQAFSRVMKLEIKDRWETGEPASLLPFYRLSPAVESLSFGLCTLASSQASGLIKSFPLVKDVSVTFYEHWEVNDADFDEQPTAVQPPSSPPLTGSLKLYGRKGILTSPLRLFPLPGDLHFRGLYLPLGDEEDFCLATELVLRCSSTLETLEIERFGPCGFPMPVGSIDLSKATKLKEVVLGSHINPKWITLSLETITRGHRDLQQITIDIPHAIPNLHSEIIRRMRFNHPPSQVFYREWLELDRVLAQFRRTRGIRLKVIYCPPVRMERTKVRYYITKLLPEVTTGGTVELAEGDYRVWPWGWGPVH